MLDDSFRSLFETNMGIRPGERIVVFGDRIRDDEAIAAADRERRLRLLATAEEAAAFAARIYGNSGFLSFPATAASGAEPPEELWRCCLGDCACTRLIEEGLLAAIIAKKATPQEVGRAREIAAAHSAEAADVIIAMANNSTSHTGFRAIMNATGCRYASLPHFDPAMFLTSMQVDWTKLAARTARLAEAIDDATTVRVTTANGTSLTFSKEGRRAMPDDGILTAPGSFGNLPAGEVFLAPVEGTAEGLLVLEYGPMRRLAAPLRLTVHQGLVTSVEGNDPLREYLEAKFAESEKNRNIAELGIGTNDRASRPDNILEAEKILGTIHVALGDNHGFGGTVTTPYHEDFVFYQPTLVTRFADDTERTVIDSGRFLV